FAFALLQGVDIVAQRFDWPPAVERYLILALIVGFFVVLVLAWYHGEKGAQRIGGMEIMILALLLAIGGGLIWRFGAVAKAPHVMQVAKTTTPAASVEQAPAKTSPSIPAAGIPEKSVAVLPFANMSGDPKQQFFSDGLSEDLINTLSQYQGLKVISRDSAFQFRDSKDSSAKIGKLLGVAHLLEGSVQRAGDEVRITATLVDAANGSIVWSQRYDKPYTDLFKLQDAITDAVATALRTQLVTAPGAVLQTDRPPSGSLAAYTAYQQGNADSGQGTEAGFRKAIADYQTAIRLDPNYAAAYARLAAGWLNLGGAFLADPGKIAQAYAKARAAVATSLKLDPDSASGHDARSNLLTNVDMDWDGAEIEARRMLQLAPTNAGAKYALATRLATLGRVLDAVKLTRQALTSDPRNANWYNWLGGYLTSLGRLDEATTAANRAIALQPGAIDFHEQLAVIAVLRGQPKVALAAAQKEPSGPWHDIAMALALQIGPDRKSADAALQSLITKYPKTAPYQIAEVYALRKDPDTMFQWLDRAWSNRDPGIANLLYDPFILRYRNDPRFAAFCKKVGLPTTTDAVAIKM
ncbi:MAG TPA: tetratricopeptide repeat protein, partial [Rhodanobacteraceae bacterium]|nr:tetratricopeptide repeat protein [Rhodanobacteraceae bacterium]